MVEKVLPGGIYKDLNLSGSDADDEVYLEVDAGRAIQFLYGQFEISTSDVVGNRVYIINIRCGSLADAPILPLYYITVGESETKSIALGTSTPANTEVDDSIILPPELILTKGDKLWIQVFNGKMGDNWSLKGKYREWID